MSDIINLPESATDDDKRAFVGENEIWSSISETHGGRKHVTAAPGLDLIGKRVVSFEKVRDCPADTSIRAKLRATFLGWKKVDTGYVIEGFGAEYKDKFFNELRCNYYVREA